MSSRKQQARPKAPKAKKSQEIDQMELLERLFEMTCPSCDKHQIRNAAQAVAAEA